MNANGFALPLDVVWDVTVDGFFMPRVSPLVEAGTIAVRCGDTVLRVDAATGAVAWRADVGQRAGDGAFLAALGDGLVTNVVRRPQRLARLVGISHGGVRAWTYDVDAILAAAAAVGDALFVVGVAPAEEATIVWRVEPNGHVAEAFRPTWGVSALASAGDRLLVRNSFADAGPGLYTTATDGSAAHALIDEPVISGQSPAFVTRSPNGSYVLRVLEGWSRPVDAEAVATSDDVVVAIEAGQIVARSVADETQLWTADAPAEILTLDSAGGVVLVTHTLGRRLLHVADGRVLGDVEGTWGSPVLAGDILVLVGEGHVLGVVPPD